MQAGGMKMRRTEKKEAPAAAPVASAKAAPAEVAGKARVLGHFIPAEKAAPTPAEAWPTATGRPSRRPEELQAPPVGTVLDVTVDKIESFGLFVKWAGGRGLLPISEMEVPRNADLRKSHPVGTVLKAAVVEARDGKVRLSMTAAAQAEERKEMQEWQQTQKPASGKGFGTFADLLAKMKK
jgi:small subunit ribosomal protein S1